MNPKHLCFYIHGFSPAVMFCVNSCCLLALSVVPALAFYIVASWQGGSSLRANLKLVKSNQQMPVWFWHCLTVACR